MNTENKQVPATQERKPATIKGLLAGDEFKKAVAMALPKHLNAERFVRVALTALTRTPLLGECDQGTFFTALLNLSQLGLEPDGRNAHLIPFKNSKRNCYEVQLIIDYKGLVDLAMRSGKVSYIHADIVCENDVFVYDKGEIKRHEINFREPRGEMYAVYSFVRFKDGNEQAVVLSKHEVNGIRSRSRAKDSGPWVTDYNEMAKKTAFRRLSKWIQLSPEYLDALDHDADQLEEHRFEAAKPIFTDAPGMLSAPSQSFDEMFKGGAPERELEPVHTEPVRETAPPKTQRTTTAPKQETSLPTDSLTPQQELEQIVTAAGFDFELFRKWGADTGNLDDADSLPSWAEVPTKVCQRLIKARTGFLMGLKAMAATAGGTR